VEQTSNALKTKRFLKQVMCQRDRFSRFAQNYATFFCTEVAIFRCAIVRPWTIEHGISPGLYYQDEKTVPVLMHSTDQPS
jgi:hypothetical protein